MTAFADALDDLFADSNMAVTVTYQGSSIRALVRRPDRDIEFSDITVHTGTAVFDIRRKEVASPAAGDVIVHDGDSFVVQGEPRLDAERQLWTITVRPA
ncbi:head-tail joining protein [Magnetospirillum moscoviense]|uniref:Uncharacterized protein n=1 Tax=Magnetospirillum moscoviense TaxID=1437059 RepID=A0A178MDM6_9PROT|nr:hypothetical protein [Magnetospirillum moscoviense]OAN46869.1 hypothetical protein A6A05_16020 [Magnetospirillum moscoviense]